MACAILPIQTVTFEGSREQRFKSGIAYYAEKLDVPHTEFTFDILDYSPYNKNNCAWVVRDAYVWGLTHVGLSRKAPWCRSYKPEWLALHEVCHLRWAHTSPPFESTLTNNQKEAEVEICMRAYEKLERKSR